MDKLQDDKIGETAEEQIAAKEIRVGHYFLDEAGDSTLFDAKGRVLIGTEGCSRFSMLGLLDVKDPITLSRELDDLRNALLEDPYFRGVPSMQKEQRKTALAFHAKDDIPEVRREVYSLLMRHDVRFAAVVQDKRKILEYVRRRNQEDETYKYHPNQSYDYQVGCLLGDKLHKRDMYHIHFSRRGNSDRTDALRDALKAKRRWYSQHFNIADTSASLSVSAHYPSDAAGLQAVDYFLWALQRFYEKKEVRYLEFVWPKCMVINDRDASENNAGMYFTRKKPPSLAALKEMRGI